MSRGYGKYRRGGGGGGGGGSHASFHFDNLFKENANKPSAARSAATVGKWGITSFTSIRTINGVPRAEKKPAAEEAPRPKKFFKSRNSSSSSSDAHSSTTSSAYSKSTSAYNLPGNNKRSRANVYEHHGSSSSERTTRGGGSPTRKFFPSKASSSSPTEKSNQDQKPPIVLRICRGKSQLLNDSDESESTPTPSSTPSTSSAVVTSPRSLRETTNRPTNCRITRSARRSMQQEPSGSPATADTPGEFSLFTSPKANENDLSPVYIPAEKYELERKAMYDNLLRPNSPRRDGGGEEETLAATDVVVRQDDSIVSEESRDNPGSEEVVGEEEEIDTIDASVKDMEIEEPIDATGGKGMNRSPTTTIPTTTTTTTITVVVEKETPLTVIAEVNRTEDVACAGEAEVVAEPAETKLEQNKKLNVDEWSTDTDSNSTAPEMEVRQIIPDPDYTVAPALEQDDKVEEKEDEQQAPPVKLVISKKKGSIFKSRSLVEDATKKRRALYRHKWTDDNKEKDEKDETKPQEVPVNIMTEFEFSDSFTDGPLERVVKDNSDGEVINTLRCNKGDKQFYTVVRNVKKAHQIQEIGEFQEFNDDVEYILDALQDNNPISTRCLSAITLASKCMVPAFRMHVRAHGTVGKFFKALHDATKDQSLGLCTATVMFVLSQDRLNMDLDRDCLELMLNLLESDVSYQQALDECGLSSAQLEKNKQKVRELCAEIQSQGHAMHLNLESITVGQLAMETLLSLTSKRAGEWFKEELRELGGLEHIMKTIHECCRQVSDYVVAWTDTLLDKLRKVDRCLRVLENVTQNNEENQTYILNYNDGMILDTLVNLYKLCDREIPLYPVTDISDKTSTGTIIREALLVTLKVLINLTHHFNPEALGSRQIGLRPGIIDTSLHLLLQVPNYIPEQKKFELGVLVLMLLINLIQDQEFNKKLLIDAKAPSKRESIYSREESAVEALIAQYYQWEGCAKLAEKKTNAILDGEKDSEDPAEPQPKTNEEFIEETVAKLLQKAGTHMEYTFLASYIVMLIGFLIMDNDGWQTFVRQFLKGSNFGDMVELLKKFFDFMNLTTSTASSGVGAVKDTEKVIKFLEACDKPSSAATPENAVSFSENIGMDLSFRLSSKPSFESAPF